MFIFVQSSMFINRSFNVGTNLAVRFGHLIYPAVASSVMAKFFYILLMFFFSFIFYSIFLT